MRHAAGELADHLHFLRFDKLRFQFLAFGNVNAGADKTRPAIYLNPLPGEIIRRARAVLGDKMRFRIRAAFRKNFCDL